LWYVKIYAQGSVSMFFEFIGEMMGDYDFNQENSVKNCKLDN